MTGRCTRRGVLKMIKSEREKNRKLQEIKDCEKLIAQNRELLERIGLSQDQIEKHIQPSVALLRELQAEVTEYNSLTQGNPPSESIEKIGDMLVKLRIYKQLTQKALAEKIGVDETQVSRDERNHYRGVSLDRLLKVVQALDVHIEVTIKKQSDLIEA